MSTNEFKTNFLFFIILTLFFQNYGAYQEPEKKPLTKSELIANGSITLISLISTVTCSYYFIKYLRQYIEKGKSFNHIKINLEKIGAKITEDFYTIGNTTHHNLTIKPNKNFSIEQMSQFRSDAHNLISLFNSREGLTHGLCWLFSGAFCSALYTYCNLNYIFRNYKK